MGGNEGLVQSLYDVIFEPVIIFLIGLGILVFVWGIVELIIGSGSEEARRKGQQHIMWGLIGIVIMTSSLAIGSFILKSLPDDASGQPPAPPVILE